MQVHDELVFEVPEDQHELLRDGVVELMSAAANGVGLHRRLWLRSRRADCLPVKKFAGTVLSHRELLFNYSRAKKQFSSGVIESLNNKAKDTLRKASGYRTFRIAELSLCHALGRLPEPKLAHRCF